MLSRSERATQNFYQWEYPYRGYRHFDTPVDIEVPYRPYRYLVENEVVDDGRAPSLFERIENLLTTGNGDKVKKEPHQEIIPHRVRHGISLVGCRISFPKGQEILPKRNMAFISMLSYSDHVMSFEIIGTDKKIHVQFVTSIEDESRIRSLLSAYFPSVIIQSIDPEDLGFNQEQDIAIADFGLQNECMRPIQVCKSFSIDPLTSTIALLDSLEDTDIAMVQVIFKGITSPLAKDLMYSVSDGQGGSFFSDAPEMLSCAKEKVSSSLFSVVLRISTQGYSDSRSQYLASELARSLVSASQSQYNHIIPLSNEGYDYYAHHYNVYHRQSNRIGFVLNAQELSTFVHYPNGSIVSTKLRGKLKKTKKSPQQAINGLYDLGVNEHNGVLNNVGVSIEEKLRHIHILGATGVGKSTLIAQMILSDINQGNGCALFDPHGDIVNDVMARIANHRLKDVIIIDPSDLDFPVGFNLLSASSEAQKMVLSSDLVSAFKQTSTSWGDNMTAVLSNAINTFLESSRTGTLIELKRFLLEDSFRASFLKSVDDPSIHYYWEHEYYMAKKRIAPLLTRIDTFLRPKIIRYMMSQTEGIDISQCIEDEKIVLIKLSQGLIGKENSYLLGSLFLSKFYQGAQGRQSLAKEQRHPYYLYLDECHNFITPSMASMLSGVRKYGLGLVLAHQELGQISDANILNSFISNPHVRICFRLGDSDAKKLASSFSYFDHEDLQNLGIGKAIVRLGKSTDDFNLSTIALEDVSDDISQERINMIMEYTRMHHARPRREIEDLLLKLLPKGLKRTKPSVTSKENPKVEDLKPVMTELKNTITNDELLTPQVENNGGDSFEQQKQTYLKQHEEKESLRKHRSLQQYVRVLAQQRNYKVNIEYEIHDGYRIDVALIKNDCTIGIEISVTNSLDYEVHNLQKCIDAKMKHIFMVSDSSVHLKNIKQRARKQLSASHIKRIQFIDPSQLAECLDALEGSQKPSARRVRGYRVKSQHIEINNGSAEEKKRSLSDIILKSITKKSKG